MKFKNQKVHYEVYAYVLTIQHKLFVKLSSSHDHGITVLDADRLCTLAKLIKVITKIIEVVP